MQQHPPPPTAPESQPDPRPDSSVERKNAPPACDAPSPSPQAPHPPQPCRRPIRTRMIPRRRGVNLLPHPRQPRLVISRRITRVRQHPPNRRSRLLHRRQNHPARQTLIVLTIRQNSFRETMHPRDTAPRIFVPSTAIDNASADTKPRSRNSPTVHASVRSNRPAARNFRSVS